MLILSNYSINDWLFFIILLCVRAILHKMRFCEVIYDSIIVMLCLFFVCVSCTICLVCSFNLLHKIL